MGNRTKWILCRDWSKEMTVEISIPEYEVPFSSEKFQKYKPWHEKKMTIIDRLSKFFGAKK
jgi:hypothetical protein